MTRTVGSHGPTTADAIMKAGLTLIYEHSYEVFTLRDLASKVGIKVGSLYNYIDSKQDLLARLIVNHLVDLLAAADRAILKDGDPIEGIATLIEFHLNYHIHKKKEVSIGASELRSLEDETYKRVIAMRNTYEQILIRLLERAADEGRITVGDVRVTAFAILAMLTGICSWYSPRGRVKKDELIRLHTELVLRGLGATRPPVDGG